MLKKNFYFIFSFFIFQSFTLKCDLIEKAIQNSDLITLKKTLIYQRFKLTKQQKENYKKLSNDVIEKIKKRKIGYQDINCIKLGALISIYGISLCIKNFPAAMSIGHYLKNSPKTVRLRTVDNTDLEIDLDNFTIFQASIVKALWSGLIAGYGTFLTIKGIRKKCQKNELRNAYVVADIIDELTIQ
ncbi:hypothetical protein M1446_04940 [Candidatus Dependentiae bacterium]|nr:hypothetical protein [Candidatus Dependentiae bacterium]